MNYTTNRTCDSPYDGQEYIGVTVVSVISGFISFLASWFVIMLIMFFKKWRYPVQRLILYLSVTTLIQGLGVMLHRVDYVENDPDKMNFCVVAGFFEQQAGWMQLNAVTCITVHLFLSAVVRIRLEKLEPLYIFIIFLLPFLFNWIPFIQLAYGKAGAWCWIRDTDETNCVVFDFGRVMRFVLWYVPLYLILVTLVVLYVFILIRVHRNRRHWVGSYDPNSERVRAQIQEEVTPIIWYPLIYLALNLIPFVNRIHNLANPDTPILGLWYLHAFTYPLTGGFIALAFTLDPSTRKRLHWASIKAAAMELYKGKDISEYPIENESDNMMSANKEGSDSFNDTQRNSSYKSFSAK